jgi:predicted Zn-dependent protease with MMP-like domain
LRLSDDEFESLVVDVLDGLPVQILDKMANVDVVIEPWPSQSQLNDVGVRKGSTLFGLYQGVPLTARNGGYSLIPPDKITIFKGPIERSGRTHDEVAAQVRKTVIHEIAHHFGIGETRLEELGWS